ncbi:hypothetical protein BDK51DRAFT_38699 [Blyttiomyces helicus]|uniref:Potassium channel tetramerisation-type BTB domain-containing protein n=1 Tax=Blyttiomyces helicus TaxID=388810 RepID=A0A4P9W5F9_9FUNG|nr:hypothetical protein BDK51DRAFT_38699 [Blyttiomyces helicus]|eukprot:RKO87494.1 hypothetical protein BDK51DRAFT_38699 [Blyttiomyces helicus]
MDGWQRTDAIDNLLTAAAGAKGTEELRNGATEERRNGGFRLPNIRPCPDLREPLFQPTVTPVLLPPARELRTSTVDPPALLISPGLRPHEYSDSDSAPVPDSPAKQLPSQPLPVKMSSPLADSLAPAQTTPFSTWALYALAAIGFLTIFSSFFQSPTPRRPRVTLRGEGTVLSADQPPSGEAKEMLDVVSEPEGKQVATDYGKVAGNIFTKALVNGAEQGAPFVIPLRPPGAVMLKKSPIPDLLSSCLDSGVETYQRLDSAFSLEEKIAAAGRRIVTAGVTVTSTVATAAIKAGVAYQLTPGREAQAVTAGSDSLLNGIPASDARPVPAAPLTARTVERIRLVEGAVPGSFPLPTLVEVSTQTAESSFGPLASQATSNGSARPALTASLPLPRTGTVTGVIANCIDTSFRIAGSVATVSSETILGRETTDRLRGIDPAKDLYLTPLHPLDGTVAYLDVGGVRMATTIETLTAEKASKLGKMFGDDASRAKIPLVEGRFFLDRDGTYFRHILNYLRKTPTLTSLTTRSSLLSLRLEALHWGLPSLVRQIDSRLEALDAAGVSASWLEQEAWVDAVALTKTRLAALPWATVGSWGTRAAVAAAIVAFFMLNVTNESLSAPVAKEILLFVAKTCAPAMSSKLEKKLRNQLGIVAKLESPSILSSELTPFICILNAGCTGETGGVSFDDLHRAFSAFDGFERIEMLLGRVELHLPPYSFAVFKNAQTSSAALASLHQTLIPSTTNTKPLLLTHAAYIPPEAPLTGPAEIARAIPGLIVVPDFIDADEERHLLEEVARDGDAGRWVVLAKRRVVSGAGERADIPPIASDAAFRPHC